MVRYREIVEEVDHDKILKLLKTHFKFGGKSQIDGQGWITIEYCKLSSRIAKLPVVFARSGTFECSNKGLTSLEGAPKNVNGNFFCAENQLTSLAGGPIIMSLHPSTYNCSHNRKLTSLEGCPEIVGSLVANGCALITLVGAPSTCSVLEVSSNNLTSLHGLPESMHRLNCSHNKLISLRGCPSQVESLLCDQNPFQSLDGFPKDINYFSVGYLPNLPMLRSLTTKSRIGCNKENGDNEEPLTAILNKYNGKNYSRANIIACQKELIDAGYEGNAAW